MSIYDQLTTEALIKAIQRTSIMIATAESRKSIPSTKLNRARKDLATMRGEVVPRLKAMNRMDAKFFPLDCHVVYQPWQPAQDFDEWGPDATVPPRNGIVTGHIMDQVIVKLEGEKYPILIEPANLKIKFIR